MGTTQTPALDMDKLNAFIGQFVMDPGAAVHTGMVVIGEKLGLYKAWADGHMSASELAAKTKTDERYLREWLSSQAAGGTTRASARSMRSVKQREDLSLPWNSWRVIQLTITGF
ncbi:MAG: hypothetical protein WB622_10250 [Acidobacteriaceae bacterium]